MFFFHLPTYYNFGRSHCRRVAAHTAGGASALRRRTLNESIPYKITPWNVASGGIEEGTSGGGSLRCGVAPTTEGTDQLHAAEENRVELSGKHAVLSSEVQDLRLVLEAKEQRSAGTQPEFRSRAQDQIGSLVSHARW